MHLTTFILAFVSFAAVVFATGDTVQNIVVVECGAFTTCSDCVRGETQDPVNQQVLKAEEQCAYHVENNICVEAGSEGQLVAGNPSLEDALSQCSCYDAQTCSDCLETDLCGWCASDLSADWETAHVPESGEHKAPTYRCFPVPESELASASSSWSSSSGSFASSSVSSYSSSSSGDSSSSENEGTSVQGKNEAELHQLQNPQCKGIWISGQLWRQCPPREVVGATLGTVGVLSAFSVAATLLAIFCACCACLGCTCALCSVCRSRSTKVDHNYIYSAVPQPAFATPMAPMNIQKC